MGTRFVPFSGDAIVRRTASKGDRTGGWKEKPKMVSRMMSVEEA